MTCFQENLSMKDMAYFKDVNACEVIPFLTNQASDPERYLPTLSPCAFFFQNSSSGDDQGRRDLHRSWGFKLGAIHLVIPSSKRSEMSCLKGHRFLMPPDMPGLACQKVGRIWAKKEVEAE